MGLSPTDKKIRLQERRLGAKAAKMVESYVKNKISRSLKIHNLGGIAPNGKPIKPILEATKVKAKTGSHRLLGLNLTSNQYGFIHHYGASSRTEHIVQLKNTAFVRKSHAFKLKAKGLFDDIYQKSGALELLSEGLSETRTNAVSAHIKGVVVELNKQSNG